MELSDALKKLAVTSLRGKQADAINTINRGVDVIYLFPTGTGKTVMYEASALCSDAASLVVSPLIGLLQQQANRLADRGVTVLTAYDGKVTRVTSASFTVHRSKQRPTHVYEGTLM
jgi:superfamily II DNA helicase RecQ